MTTIGFIGAGHIGGTVARLAVDAGYDVVLSNSRGPDTLVDQVLELGSHARAATTEEAAAAGDIVVVTIPLNAYRSVPVEPLAGKPVIDTTNYYPQRDGQLAELDDGTLTSSALVQRHLSGAHVVKCFNNILFRHLRELARPSGSTDRSALPIAGDDAEAKRAVTAFLDAIGYDAVDVGALSDSWRAQPGTPVYGVVYAGGEADFASSPGVPASASSVRQAIAEAKPTARRTPTPTARPAESAGSE